MTFSPEDIMRTIAEGYARVLLYGVDPDNRPTRYIEQPRDPAWLKARERFTNQWNSLTEYGRRRGFLEREHCYECGGELKPTEDTTEWVEEPNPDYDPDKPNPYKLPEGGTITIPKARS